MPSRLADSPSPYLRQHADNPVDWFPWGDEAISQAREADRPIFLSVGYSACHWCHVMAHESFEDEGVAKALNEHFVSIKVDREERPDVDETYMTAVQLATGHGGWPMTVFLTPDLKPFFAGTYFPRDDRGGHPGFRSIVRGIAEGWKSSRDEFVRIAEEFAAGLADALGREAPPSSALSSHSVLSRTVSALAHDFDPRHGGFGGAPKFPPHTAIELLLHLSQSEELTSEERDQALGMADLTLRAMAAGGIRDHVGGGFHRYSTDAEWLLPHFEKMLVDNALMLSNFALGARVLRNAGYLRVCEEIVEWLEREMRSEDGLFYAALDADSEGEEGKFYTWTWDEVRTLLGDRAAPFMEAYGFARNGNFRDEATGKQAGVNILCREMGDHRTFAEEMGILRQARERRPRPGLDDKALVGQNGLIIAGLVAAGRLDLAKAAAETLIRFDADDLPRLIVNGVPHGHGYLEDYAGLAFGLAELAKAEPEGPWRDAADKIARRMNELFEDAERGAYFATSSRHDRLFGRTKPSFDQPGPSANALAIRALIRLGDYDPAERGLSALMGWVDRLPTATEALQLAMFELLSNRPGSDSRGVQCEVLETEWKVEDGITHGEVQLQIPSGFHLNGPSPSLAWLIPTKVTVAGINAKVNYPLAAGDRYEGNVRISIEIETPPDVSSAEITVSWQACTDTECLQPEERRFEVSFVR